MNDQQRAAMQMALEALEVLLTCKHGEFCDHYRDAESQSKKAITALREVLAQQQDTDTMWWPSIEPKPKAQPQGEPVAWIHTYPTGAEQINRTLPEMYTGNWKHQPLYTTPPSVEAAIEATKEEFIEIVRTIGGKFAQEAEAAIRSMK